MIWFTQNFCCVALLIRTYIALNSTEILLCEQQRQSTSWVPWQAPHLYAQMASCPLVMLSSNYSPFVTNTTRKWDRTCLTIYFPKVNITIVLTVCSKCSLKTHTKPFFSNHEESLHIYMVYCTLYAHGLLILFSKREYCRKLIDRVASIFFPLVLRFP